MAQDLNDVVPSWVDIRLDIDGEELTGFESVSFGDKIEDEMVYGAGRLPRGRTRGTYVTEDGSLAVHKDVEIELIRRFGDGWGDKKFQITETIGLPDGTNSITVVESCRFKGSGGGGEKGNSALTRELPFSFMRIKRDGKYLVAGNR